jgi:protein-S-isoprenylcysteine O-methyltransferase Ste14
VTDPGHRPAKRTFSHLLVATQMGAIVLTAWPIAGSGTHTPWLALSALGALIGLYTLAHNRLGNFGIYPEPLADACLVTTGPYRWVRHPMYTSLLLFMLGIALYHGAWPNYVALGVLVAAIFGKIRLEEHYLHTRFEDYSDYVKRTHRLLPKIF